MDIRPTAEQAGFRPDRRATPMTSVRRWWRGDNGHRVRVAAALFAVSLTGVLLGVLVAGNVRQDVGPFRAEFALAPSLSGGTEVKLPPLGSLSLRSHAGPARLVIDLAALDSARTRELVRHPNGVTRASDDAVGDITTGVARLALQTVGAAVLAAMGLAALLFRSVRRVAACGCIALAITAGSLATAASTFRRSSLAEPTYTGLLTNARAVVGDARKIADRYDEYRAQLQRMVGNVSQLYTTITTLPVYEPSGEAIRVLHISDLHLNPAAWSVVQSVVEQWDIDVVVDSGDITDWGSVPEASYVNSIGQLGVPYVFVRGNHDSVLTQAAVSRQPRTTVLDNEVATVAGLTIAGIGDPRFTPDKSAEPADPVAAEVVRDELRGNGSALAATIRANPEPVDIAIVHDPAAAGPLAGLVPLVLAGHRHHREVIELRPSADGPNGVAGADGVDGVNAAAPTNSPGAAPPKRTTLRVEGSTGGAGLRGLESGEPLSLQLSVLYFGSDHLLQAYDEISVGGTGQAEVTLQRHLVPLPEETTVPPTPTPR
jgi:predicted phosphodiesterase